MYTKRCNMHSCYPTLRWLNASVGILCICEERRRGRKSRKGQQFTLKPRCSEAARIIQSMQLTRHSRCRTAGRRFPPSRKVTLRKGQGTVLLLTVLSLLCVCIGGRNDKEGMKKVRNTETSSGKCRQLNAVVFSSFVKRFARGNHHNSLQTVRRQCVGLY